MLQKGTLKMEEQYRELKKMYVPENQMVFPACLYNSITIIISISGIRTRNEFFGSIPEAIRVEITYAVIPVIIPGTS